MRNKIVEAMPLQLRKAISPGIGLFITFIGLHNAGIITGSEATLVTLGNLHTPSVLLALFGILLSAVLLVRRITGALLIGILATTIIGIPMGLTHLGGFVSAPPSLSPIFCKMEWSNICSMDMVICVFTLLFMDMFDTLGTLIGVGQRAGMVEKNGYMHGLNKAFMADAIGTTFGALVGTSTVSTYVESAAGVNAGGRSGLTAIVVAACFVLAMFFSPLFLAIPSQATAPAMILVGVMMMGEIKDIDFQDFLTAIPCFLCIVLMPMTYSISNGILMGLICWVVLHLLSGQVKSMKASTLILAVLFVLKYIFL